jgi:hypothetical protein
MKLRCYEFHALLIVGNIADLVQEYITLRQVSPSLAPDSEAFGQNTRAAMTSASAPPPALMKPSTRPCLHLSALGELYRLRDTYLDHPY